MTLPDRIRFHAHTLRSSLDVLIRAAGQPSSADDNDAAFLRAEIPLAMEDATEALAALESIANTLPVAETTLPASEQDYPKVRRG